MGPGALVRRAAATLMALVLLVAENDANAGVVHRERSLYSTILIDQRGSLICLQFSVRTDQRNQSCMDERRPHELVFSYTRMMMTGLLLRPNPARILMVGLGGGTLPAALAELYPNAIIDVVEIDPAVVKVAERFFGFVPSANTTVFTQDGRVFVKRAALRGERYDLIMLDAFNGEYIPEHLMTREYLQETKALLAPGGTLVANTFSISHLYDHESATYAEVFGDFINFRIPESSNRVVVVPGADVADAQLTERAEELTARLRPYDIPIKRYTRILIKNRRAQPDWRHDARVLTDQYAPANLLQGR